MELQTHKPTSYIYNLFTHHKRRDVIKKTGLEGCPELCPVLTVRKVTSRIMEKLMNSMLTCLRRERERERER